ncbi:MAG: hypothetical protein VCA73_18850 [Roseibacillus sp.]
MKKRKPTLAIHRRRFAQFSLIEALRKSCGSVSAACEEVGISRQTHYNWYREYGDYREQVDRTIEEFQSNLNRGFSEQLRQNLKTGGKESLRTARTIWRPEVVKRIKRGETHEFNNV